MVLDCSLFGLKHKGYNNVINGTDHNYGFGGKEEQDELGLAWMDVQARNYDPALGRWMNLDPLSEQMRRHSPYNYAFDNPIYWTDPDGMAPDDRWKRGANGNLTWVSNEGGDTTDYVDNVDAEGNVTSTDTYTVDKVLYETDNVDELGETTKSPGLRETGTFKPTQKGNSESMSIQDVGSEALDMAITALSEDLGVNPTIAVALTIVVNPKKAGKKLSRKKAISEAKDFAKVPRVSKGGEKIKMDDLNTSSRGQNWEKQKGQGATTLGQRNPNGQNKWMEHPDGHPNTPGASHHDSPHINATNPAGQTTVIEYDN